MRRTAYDCVKYMGTDVSKYFDAAIGDLMIAQQNCSSHDTPHPELSGLTPKEAIVNVALVLRVLKKVMCRDKEKNIQHAYELLKLVYSELDKPA